MGTTKGDDQRERPTGTTKRVRPKGCDHGDDQKGTNKGSEDDQVVDQRRRPNGSLMWMTKGDDHEDDAWE